jgi:lysophospholipase L1-like esterase
MTDINTTTLKRPLGRTVKDRLLRQQRDRNRSGSNNNDICCGFSGKWVTFWFVLTGFWLVIRHGIMEPMIMDTFVGNNVDAVNNISSRMSAATSGDMSMTKKEEVKIGTVQNQDTHDNKQDLDKDKAKPIEVTPLSTIHNRPIRIFCYGDSLTAGVAPPTRTFFPYAETLQKSLTDRATEENKFYTFEVDHAGFPGWTAEKLHEQLISDRPNNNNNINVQQKLLLRDPNKSDASYYDILIYLAGSNDLGREVSEHDIVMSVLNVHSWAHHTARIPFTIAISVPPSAYQSHNPTAAKRAATVNEEVAKVIRQNFRRFSFTKASTLWTPFPISWEEKEWWATDGLHLSQRGYERLGKYLASVIYERMFK